MEQNEILFCPYCGTKLDPGARFCKNCGKAIRQVNRDSSESEHRSDYRQSGNPNQRKTVYEGYIHRCPNCGEVLKSFVAVCPACGYEIRDTQSTNSVKELSEKIEKIDAQKMPVYQEKSSILKTLIGKDFKDDSEARLAELQFETEKKEQKASLIKNFPIPNTREDILELMLLVASNINVNELINDNVSKAWLSKFDQVYERAKLSMGDSPEFKQIKMIYDRKMSEIKSHKYKSWATIAFFIGGIALLACLIYTLSEGFALAAGIVSIVGIAILVLGFKLHSKYRKEKHKGE